MYFRVSVNYLLSYCQPREYVLQSDCRDGVLVCRPMLFLRTALQADAGSLVPLKQDLRFRGQRGLLKVTGQVVEVTVPSTTDGLCFFQKIFSASSKLRAYCSMFSIGKRTGFIFGNRQKFFAPHYLVKLAYTVDCALFLRCQP